MNRSIRSKSVVFCRRPIWTDLAYSRDNSSPEVSIFFFQLVQNGPKPRQSEHYRGFSHPPDVFLLFRLIILKQPKSFPTKLIFQPNCGKTIDKNTPRPNKTSQLVSNQNYFPTQCVAEPSKKQQTQTQQNNPTRFQPYSFPTQFVEKTTNPDPTYLPNSFKTKLIF